MTAGHAPLRTTPADRSAPATHRGWHVAGAVTLGLTLLLAVLTLFIPAHKDFSVDPQGSVYSCDMNNPGLLLLFSKAGALALLAHTLTLPFTVWPYRSAASWSRTALCLALVLLFAVRGQAAQTVLAQQDLLGCEESFAVSPPGS